MASFVETRGHAGDEGDFEALYETYKSDVQRLASYLLKNASDAEDAAQTVFLNVLRALRQGVTPSDPRAWLLAITRNVCFSRHRAAAARPSFVELDFEPSEDPSGEETPSADEIVGALARMLPNQRTALILRDFRGVSRSEIGHLMALSPAAVEALLTRARAVFREELEAGEQPFVCAETRALVEKQLDGEITVADRHYAPLPSPPLWAVRDAGPGRPLEPRQARRPDLLAVRPDLPPRGSVLPGVERHARRGRDRVDRGRRRGRDPGRGVDELRPRSRGLADRDSRCGSRLCAWLHSRPPGFLGRPLSP